MYSTRKKTARKELRRKVHKMVTIIPPFLVFFALEGASAPCTGRFIRCNQAGKLL